MAKQSTAKTTAKTTAETVELLQPTDAQAKHIDAFADAAASVEKHGRIMVDACVALRDAKKAHRKNITDKDKRIWLQAACTAAGMAEKSVQNRVADAMAIIRAPRLPSGLPASLQLAAKMVRETAEYKALSAKGGTAGPRAGSRSPQAGGKAPKRDTTNVPQAGAIEKISDSVGPIDCEGIRKALAGTLAGLRKRAKDEDAQMLVDDLIETLNA